MACIAGAFNILRIEKSPIGEENMKEYGSPRTADGFRSLLAMDAVHAVHDGVAYPAIYLVAGANDARLPEWQSAGLWLA